MSSYNERTPSPPPPPPTPNKFESQSESENENEDTRKLSKYLDSPRIRAKTWTWDAERTDSPPTPRCIEPLGLPDNSMDDGDGFTLAGSSAPNSEYSSIRRSWTSARREDHLHPTQARYYTDRRETPVESSTSSAYRIIQERRFHRLPTPPYEVDSSSAKVRAEEDCQDEGGK